MTQLAGDLSCCLDLPRSWSPNVVMQRVQVSETVAHSMQGRREVLGLDQDMPADVFCYPGEKCWGHQLRPHLPLSVNPTAEMLWVSDCCIQIHNLFEFCTGAATSYIHRPAAHDHFTGARRVWKRVRGNLTSLLYLAWHIKSNQIPMLYFYRKAKIALIKRPFVKRPLFNILCKGAFANH